ncbi:MAG: trehalose operon repressor [Lactovum sp.]
MKKYEETLKYLEDKIEKGIYKWNDFLPSEIELCEQFKVSRSTVRQALSILEKNGWIQKQQGRGSIVIPRHKMQLPVSDLTSYKELQENLKMKNETQVVSFKQIKIDKKLSTQTMFPIDSNAFYIERTRKMNGKVIILDKDIIRADLAPNLTAEIASQSIFDYLENSLGYEISYAQKEITIDLIDDNDTKYMDLHFLDRHIVSIKSHVFLKDNTIFQYSESHHQVDQFKISEFARRYKRK